MTARNISAANITGFVPGLQCFNQAELIPLSLQYSDEVFWPFAIDGARDDACNAPGCVVLRSYNMTSKRTGDNIGYNVTDTEDVRRRCANAKGEYVHGYTMWEANGTRTLAGYCAVREVDHVGPLVSNLTGLERSNVQCSTQQFRSIRSGGTKGKVMTAGLLVISLAVAVVTTL